MPVSDNGINFVLSIYLFESLIANSNFTFNSDRFIDEKNLMNFSNQDTKLGDIPITCNMRIIESTISLMIFIL